MIRNYVVAALRNMRRYKVFTFINITGLAIGLSICMVIIMSVSHQMESDRYNSRKDRIYRVTGLKVNSTSIFRNYATVSLPLSGVLESHSGVEQVVRIQREFGRHWMGLPDEEHIPLAGFFADSGFIELFEYPMLYGDAESALSRPYSVVLTKKAAIKLYGEEDAMGKVIDMDELGQYTVTGVLDMSSVSSHIEFEAVASMSSTQSLVQSGVLADFLSNFNVYTSGWVYFALRPGTDPSDISQFIDKAAKENMDQEAGILYGLQGLTDIKPGKLMGNEIGPVMPCFIIYILGWLGLIIMLSSCFNYINLSVARSMSRSREVGIRKVNGAGKWQVIYQFIIESVLLALFSLGLAIILLIYFEPAFEQLNFARMLRWELSHEPVVWVFILAFTLLTGVIAGFFPSIVMANFQPLQVIKGIKNLKVFSHVGMRKVLIVSQFTLSLFFIISIMIFYNQVKMMTMADNGYEAENVILIPYDEDTYSVMNKSLQEKSWVENVSRSSHIPSTGTIRGEGLGRTQEEAEDGVSFFAVDDKYLKNLNIPLIAGRMLSPREAGDEENEVVINEKSLPVFRFETAQDAIGETLYTSDSNRLTVVGVIPDYHHEGLMVKINPLVLRSRPDFYNYLQIRVHPEKIAEAKVQIAQIWKEHHPDQITYIQTMKEAINEFYDMIFGDLVSILFLFAILATFISCLGLLGIAIYTTELRMKEVSIRKVLGAENSTLVFILSWGFLKLVLIATGIAIPLAYFANDLWLSMMATKITMSPWFYISGTLLLMTVALLTIGSQTLRSLKVNPADSLRTE